ncbi:MAG TPA: glycosyltransferase family A protein, partial [Candidatus Hodarchaeales archaeon]|nr:glycosyltransferase family A protein [Candidatus Hodarchaeales archaeon]
MCYSQRVLATSEHSSRLVSVIVPVYNGQETICRAIDSALRQTYREHEIIVVDDGSTDSSLKLLQNYRRKIRLVQQKRGGAASARNHALRMA